VFVSTAEKSRYHPAVKFLLGESQLWPKVASWKRAFGSAYDFFKKLKLLKAEPKAPYEFVWLIYIDLLLQLSI
jgi:hypothetical protein